MSQQPVRQGEIYWLDDCPPLQGDRAKRRPVVVISPSDAITHSETVIVAAVSTSVLHASAPDRVPLPNLQENPGCSTGLPRPCWVVPAWFLAVGKHRLDARCGALSARLRQRVVNAVAIRMGVVEG